MPRAKNRTTPHQGVQTNIGFQLIMQNIMRKLKAEGQGRDRALNQELRRQFSGVMKEVERKPRQNPLKAFQWQVLAHVSNHFWPQSVGRADRPLGIYQKSRPFVNMSAFAALDTDSLSFEKLVEFIRCNGETPFRWPRKPKEQRRKIGQMTGESNRPGDDESNPIVLSPTPNFSLRSAPSRLMLNASAQSPLEAQIACRNGTPLSRPVWDDDIEMAQHPLRQEVWMTPITKVRIPTLSFACRSGWDLNNKEIWIPAAGFELEDSLTSEESADPQPLEPVFLGPVSFTRASEKDTRAFMSSFLSREGSLTVHMDRF
ncbi:hypothetical protein F5X97DRAFT_245941 [Nemania serpens]|nr:hypothetical protein F5X97DRAFT_245941 [Nemania serpens]